ncbi:MAG: HAD-IA family hydrolase, partial [Planctomycetota bacterium]|nr:HAD-IA family hydrolase [Planctomycetota bacterium]
ADRRAFDGEEFRSITAAAYRLLHGVEPLLTELKAAGVPMHTLSNYPNWYHLIEATTGLSRWVPWTFVSCDLGLRKPDPQIYREVLRRLEVDAERCIFVDDTPGNVEAARSEGMTGIVFEGAGALRLGLVEHGLLQP